MAGGARQRLAADVPKHPALVDLAGVYHNLLRSWATHDGSEAALT
jgi:predicted 2-oxoglutarate/Fe(II)-dependent dioxygenase YbiX